MPAIYEPKGRAREYSALATNVYTGCDHGCTYCYAPDATQQNKNAFIHPRNRAASYLADIAKEAAQLRKQITPQILLSFTCDPYQAFDVTEQRTRRVLEILKQNSLNFCTLTKGGRRALRDLDLFDKGDSFATTMTHVSKAPSIEWEPGATLPKERAETLLAFHLAGVETWVSLEPVLDPRESLEVIKRTYEFVDLYKVGKLNHHPLEKSIDWLRFGSDAVRLLESLKKPYYIKDDLMAFGIATGAYCRGREQIEREHSSLPAPVAVENGLFAGGSWSIG
jgi:DNA repair photolyase